MAESGITLSSVGLPQVGSDIGSQGNGGPSTENISDWYQTASATVLNLATPDSELIRFFSDEYASASPAKQVALQQLADMRSRSAAALTQLIRLIGETARQIISNIR